MISLVAKIMFVLVIVVVVVVIRQHRWERAELHQSLEVLRDNVGS